MVELSARVDGDVSWMGGHDLSRDAAWGLYERHDKQFNHSKLATAPLSPANGILQTSSRADWRNDRHFIACVDHGRVLCSLNVHVFEIDSQCGRRQDF